MTKKELDNKISDLERENKFLRLQLKIMAELANSSNIDDMDETIGAIMYYSTDYQESLDFIKEHAMPYNFYNRLMTVDE